MEEQLAPIHQNLQLSQTSNDHPYSIPNFNTQRKNKIKHTHNTHTPLNNPNTTFSHLEMMASMPLRLNSNKIKRATEESHRMLIATPSGTVHQRPKSMGRKRTQSETKAVGFEMRLKNKYREIEKRSNKSNTPNVRGIEKWLNDLLIEYCHEEVFEASIHNPALNKFQIDRNCLISKGISHLNIDRVYRSMFVYSIGFNNLLEEICVSSGSLLVRRTLWKVYAMLLEYCAKGEFETMVGEIERDQLIKVQGLKNEILKRQKVIDSSEAVAKEETDKLHGLMRHLKDVNENLMNEIEIIDNDFKKAELAFNEEVTMRLKFEHKINEIYGVHQELSTKHATLYKDHVILQSEYNTLKKLLQSEITQKEQNMVENMDLRNTIEDLNRKIDSKSKDILKAEDKTKVLELKLESYETHRNAGIINARNEIRENKMLHFELTNIKEVLSLKEKSMEELERRVGILVEENEGMFGRIEEQNKRILALNKYQHEFQLTTLNLRGALEVAENRMGMAESEKQRMQAKIRAAEIKASDWEVEVKTSRQRVKLLTEDIQVFNKNLEILKINKHQVDDELNSMKKRYDLLLLSVQGKESSEAKLFKQLNDSHHQLVRVKEMLYNAQTTLAFKEEGFNHDTLNFKRTIDKLMIENESLMLKKEELEVSMEALEESNLKCRKEEEIAKSQLRDLMFEKNNVDLQFKQSLMMMEDESKYIKDLNISISHLQRDKDDVSRNLTQTEAILLKKEEDFKKIKGDMSTRITEQSAQIGRKLQWVHPMKYSNLEGMWLQQVTVVKDRNLEISNLDNQMSRLREQSKREIDTLKAQYMEKSGTKERELFKMSEQKTEKLEEANRRLEVNQIDLAKKAKVISQLTLSVSNLNDANSNLSARIYHFEQTVVTQKEELDEISRCKEEQLKKMPPESSQIQRLVRENNQLKSHIAQLSADVPRVSRNRMQHEKETKEKRKSVQGKSTDRKEPTPRDMVVQSQSPKPLYSSRHDRYTPQKKESLDECSESKYPDGDIHHYPHDSDTHLMPKISMEGKPAGGISSRAEPRETISRETSVRKPGLMSRKEVVTKMFGAYNYYSGSR